MDGKKRASGPGSLGVKPGRKGIEKAAKAFAPGGLWRSIRQISTILDKPPTHDFSTVAW